MDSDCNTKSRIPTAFHALLFGCCRKGKGDNMEEVWKDVQGYEGIYQVSNLGNVKSLDREVKCKNSIRLYKGKILSQCKDDKGYYRVLLSVAGKHKSAQIHRLVAEAFIDNKNKFPEVNHKDENPSNNRVDNLEWCEKIYNLSYGTGRIRSIESHRKKILQFDMNNNLISEFEGVNIAAKAIGKPKDATAITKCCQGKFKTAYGYIWKYKEAE